MKRALLAVLTVLGLGLAGCPGDVPNPQCPCTPCSTAVELTVVDGQDGGAIESFVIEALLNGEAIGTPAGCAPEDRTANFCAFGFETGVYDLVVSAPGYETRETRVRQPERGSGDLCCRACLSPRLVTLELDPL